MLPVRLLIAPIAYGPTNPPEVLDGINERDAA